MFFLRGVTQNASNYLCFWEAPNTFGEKYSRGRKTNRAKGKIHVEAKGFNTKGAKGNKTYGGQELKKALSWPMDFKYGVLEIEGKVGGLRPTA